MSIKDLQPADNRDVILYMPYYQANRKSVLPLAISLYQQGSLEGTRNIEGGDGIPFIATWNVSKLPADLTRCRMLFDGNTELSYELMLASYEFVDFLIDVLIGFKRSRVADFSQPFYRKLLKLED
ncbi:MAG: hypothetical protein VKJ46_02755 [Leptolyngbyaceae bacterium]|nr:hypothetical protein [Leptolyngbyaceae bacterium]